MRPSQSGGGPTATRACLWAEHGTWPFVWQSVAPIGASDDLRAGPREQLQADAGARGSRPVGFSAQNHAEPTFAIKLSTLIWYSYPEMRRKRTWSYPVSKGRICPRKGGRDWK